jgi:tetratricopeptide (TPR) repeat protein
MRRNLFICLLLAGITLAIYWPAGNYDLVDYDDPMFVTQNPDVAEGLTWHSFVRAMTSVTAGNWHPVTTFSFVLTHELFGTDPDAEHLVNIFFHMANTVLLFLVLLQMTGATWRSTVVAAIFAWHPLRVESVAWIAERKDVLFVFFMLLSLLCYVRYAQKRSNAKLEPPVSASRPGTRDFDLALVFFALGFMSKAMIVSLPFLLLLLDYWPLQRMTNGGFRMANFKTLLLEKIPFFVPMIVFSLMTFWIQRKHDIFIPLEKIGLLERIGHATLSYVQYLSKTVWPVNLAVHYPYPRTQDVLEIWLCGLLLLVISALCVCQIARRPYLAVGWFWFLGTAVPIIGLVQVGEQAMADRYTYLPLIGPVISLVWLISDEVKSYSLQKFLLAPMTLILLATCVILTRRQLPFWQNTESLFEHTIAVTPDNAWAQCVLASGLEDEGRLDEAMLHYQIAVAIEPNNDQAYYKIGECLENQGNWEPAVKEYKAAITTDNNSDDDVAYIANLNLAEVLLHLGRNAEAVSHYNEVLRIIPDSIEVLNNLAWLLATCPDANIRDGARAVQLAKHACELTDYQRPMFIGTLAAAYAEAGRFDDAIVAAQKACALAEELGAQGVLEKNQDLLELYRAHKPYHESAEKLVPDAK